MESCDVEQQQLLPLRTIPGSYGMPFFGALKDRLDLFWFQGQTEFWDSRLKKYNSTIFRVCVPGFPSSNVIMLLDQKSFPILFDVSKVDKKNLLLANYMPSTSFYGGFRPCVYLDPSEENHSKLKSFIMDLIKLNANQWLPQVETAVDEIFSTWESELKKNRKTHINTETSQFACNLLIRTFIGRDPASAGEASLGTRGPFFFEAWLGPQLAPIATVGIPHILEELLIHTFRIPYFLVSCFYKRLENFFKIYGKDVIDIAETKYGLDRNETLHNIIFFIGFNAFGGLSLLLPSILKYLGEAGIEVQQALAKEVREAVDDDDCGKLTVEAIKKMEMVKSTVYECLRMSPPVAYQYGRAKEDLIVETYDGRYEIKKGELIGGCQIKATRDPKVFQEPNKFNPRRFMGDEGQKLLKYVLWGNGPSDGTPSISNKQCAGANLVPFIGQAFLACLFIRYDSFSLLPSDSSSIYFSSLNRAT